MKKIFFIAFMVLAQTTIAKDKTEKTADLGKVVQELDIAAEKTVVGKGFSIVVPKGWSYLNRDDSAAPLESKRNNVVTRISPGQLLMTPDSNLAESEVYFGIHNFAPNGPKISKIYKRYKKQGAKLTTHSWNELKWEVVEYSSSFMDVDKKSKTTYNWTGVTHLKNHDLMFLAGTSSPEKRDEYRTQFETIMKSVKVIE